MNSWLGKDKNNSAGIALLLETTPNFYRNEPEEPNKLSFSYLLGYLRPYHKYLMHLVLSMLAASIIGLFFPFLTQAIVDYGINNNNLAFVMIVLIAQMVLTFGQTANEFIRSWLSLHLTTRISISLISDFLIKLMKLPISFFDIKMIGDIMQRIGDHDRIQNFLTKSLISVIFSLLTLIIYTGLMASYHLGILGIFFIGSSFYVGWILLFLKKRRNLDYKNFNQSSLNQSNVVQLIAGMQEIKLNNCEKQKRWEWERIQANLFKVRVKGLFLSQNQMLGATLIDQIKNVLISYLSAKAVIQGQMTLGMMVAVQYIIGQLNGPIQQFMSFIQNAQDAKISLERLGEIHNKKDEESPEENKIREIPKNKDILIRNLTFQYGGKNSEKVLNNINVAITANKITAIVGMSGSGKTTLIKLFLRFYQPTSGEIKLGGVHLKNYSESQWRKRCGVVMQEGYIFSDTIAHNIGIIDEKPSYSKLEKAIKIANLQNFIELLPKGYNTKIGNDGHGLSTGQKQRILIARAVYKNPDYIFLDEATNALDAKNERTIIENLDKFFLGRTVVIVAHRLSTVKRADNIIVLDQGELVEQGTHKELVTRKGAYYRLVKDQLELGS